MSTDLLLPIKHGTPFLKWPGGKRWVAGELSALIREHLTGTYFEPFLGGAAVFFALKPRSAVLSDINTDLINVYRVVKRAPRLVANQLRQYPVNEAAYLEMRASSPISSLDRAVRFLYLNRTAFGGIYRLNREGRFNVPFGGGDRTPELLWKTDALTVASRYLRKAKLDKGDFESFLSQAGLGDVVYCDPTYTVAHDSNGFVRYNEKNFSWSDQERLARIGCAASRRGAVVIISNANHDTVRELYPANSIRTIERMSSVCPNIEKRRVVTECLIVLRKDSSSQARTDAVKAAR